MTVLKNTFSSNSALIEAREAATQSVFAPSTIRKYVKAVSSTPPPSTPKPKAKK